jgi:hypothetical protein
MTEFWQLPTGVQIDVSDEILRELEDVAALVAPGGWGVELTGDGAHFRFAQRLEGTQLCFGCRATERRTSAAGRTGDDGRDWMGGD